MRRHFGSFGRVAVSLCVVTNAFAVDYSMMPLSATGSHVITGPNEIELDGGGQSITFDIRIDNWDPIPDVGACGDGVTVCSIAAQDCEVGVCTGSNGLIAAYQFTIDAAGYQDVLMPVLLPANELLDSSNPEFLFFGLTAIPAVSTVTPNWAYGAVLLAGGGVSYDGMDRYAGTLVVDVPVGAPGIYVIGFIDNPDDAFARDSNGIPIVPIDYAPATVFVRCQNHAECDDGNECTDDVCNFGSGLCENDDVTPVGQCCDPITGDLLTIDDGLDCTLDTCIPDGTVTHDPLPEGTICGDPVAGDCDVLDECDAGGNCIALFALVDTPCGDQNTTECSDPDSCDGLGTCLPNHLAPGTDCGDSGMTDCTDPDTCDGSGACDANHLPDGTGCDDGAFCTIDESCTSGQCGGGAFACDDSVACTDDSCDEMADQCINMVNDTNCDNLQFCDGVEICDPVDDCVIMPGSVPDCDDLVACTVDSCDEVNDLCLNNPSNAFCDNGQFCDGPETCDPDFDCQPGIEPDCNDQIDCTDDSCDEANDQCVNAPNDTFCPDNGMFCDGDEFCNAGVGCDSTGSPCGGPCDEMNDTCLCDAPLIEKTTSRFIAITPQPTDSEAPMAIRVTANCPSAPTLYAMAPQPLDLNPPTGPDATYAILSTDPADAVFLTPAEWGGTVYVTGRELTPETSFTVEADCGSPENPGLSEPSIDATKTWADVTLNGVANLEDVQFIVFGFQGNWSFHTLDDLELAGSSRTDQCIPNILVNLLDIFHGVGSFQGLPPSFFGCENPCP